MRKKYYFVVILSLLCGVLFNSFTPYLTATKCSLIVVQFDPANIKTLTQDIYSYNFENGEYKGKEKLLSVQGLKDGKDYIRCDIGENTIYQNRWLITGIGNIIDLKDKKVVSTERAQFIRCNGDSIIFYVNDIFKGKYYSYFNTKTKKYEEIKKLTFKALLGKDIGVDYETANRRIWLYPPNKEKVLLVADAGFGEEIVSSKAIPVIPILWLNNNEFIYPYYNISKNEATIQKVNVDKKITTIGVIKDVPKSHVNSFFRKDGDGNIEYVCPKGSFVIDTKLNKITEVIFEHEGYGFDVENKTQPYGHLIKYQKKDIGKYHCDLKQVKACPVAIALDNKLKVGAEVYPQGIAVWNTITKKWKTIDAEEVAAVTGWLVY
jgi:hypothetical protein